MARDSETTKRDSLGRKEEEEEGEKAVPQNIYSTTRLFNPLGAFAAWSPIYFKVGKNEAFVIEEGTFLKGNNPGLGNWHRLYGHSGYTDSPRQRNGRMACMGVCASPSAPVSPKAAASPMATAAMPAADSRARCSREFSLRITKKRKILNKMVSDSKEKTKKISQIFA